MGKDRKTRSGSSSTPSSKPIPSVPVPRGTCGFPECLAITAKNACESFPELEVNPSPEPDGRDKARWNEWWKGYLQWGQVQCACGNGYFCRRHGIWVPGAHVKDRLAPSYDRQLEDGCPKFHYHPEDIQDEVESSKVNPEVDSQEPLSPSHHQKTSPEAQKPSSSKSKDSKTKDSKSKDVTTPDKKRRSSGKDSTRSRHHTSHREHKEPTRKGKEVERQDQPSEPLYEEYPGYPYYRYPDSAATDTLTSHSTATYSYGAFGEDNGGAEQPSEDENQDETKHEEYTREHGRGTSPTYRPSSSRSPYFNSGIDERITNVTEELGDTSIEDSWPTSYPETYRYDYRMTTDPTDTSNSSGNVRAGSSSYSRDPQDTGEHSTDVYHGYYDAEYVLSNTSESHETVYGEEEVPIRENEKARSKHRKSKSSSKHSSRSKH